jgi:hypothetical protein
MVLSKISSITSSGKPQKKIWLKNSRKSLPLSFYHMFGRQDTVKAIFACHFDPIGRMAMFLKISDEIV